MKQNDLDDQKQQAANAAEDHRIIEQNLAREGATTQDEQAATNQLEQIKQQEQQQAK